MRACPCTPFKAIVGGTPEFNAAALVALLDGEKSAYRDAVLLNVAAALVVVDKADNLKQGVEIAVESVDSGKAKQKLALLAKITSEAD